ncbi:hypothetical protein MKZ38_006209 [Zalerion maritima]|uniref:Ribosome quality control complex subunit 2 n=1 Tax=Zalerion maritima TaxID=339359 RepID=A0AAD5WPW3_9PEZI|nr:hypothetical protein MKZ38_006209 [Zalerion maritima]
MAPLLQRPSKLPLPGVHVFISTSSSIHFAGYSPFHDATAYFTKKTTFLGMELVQLAPRACPTPSLQTISCQATKRHFKTPPYTCVYINAFQANQQDIQPTRPPKMKQRISSLDVKALSHELSSSLVSLRVANIYDLSSRILLFKFAKPDNKKQFIIDSGFRCHLTDFTRTTAPAPSGFVTRLRKVLKTRRVSSVCQIGTDRIIEFQFSDGLYKLYLEFFAAGNVILTDADHKILALLRNVHEGEGQEPQRVGLAYSLENRMNVAGVPDVTIDRVKAALGKMVERQVAAAASAKKQKKKKGDELRRGLALTINEIPPMLVDHAMVVTGFDSTLKPEEVLASSALLEKLVNTLQEARQIVDDVDVSKTCKGYILAKKREGVEIPEGTIPQEIARKDLLYSDFHPFLPKQFQDDSRYTVLTFDGFNKTVDEFYSSIEGQKLESRLTDLETTAQKKLDAAKTDQAKRIEALKSSQTVNFRKGSAIEANSERVQEAMDAVINLLEQGMEWASIGKLIEREKTRRNPVAEVIKLPLKLDKNTITLILGEADMEEDMDDEYESDSESGSGYAGTEASSANAGVEVDINLTMTPWANAREYYEERKTGKSKEQKTIEANMQALKNVEKRVAEDLRKGLQQEKAVLHATRIQYWFEKFVWFLSSDGYLVLSGRDPQQNETLYRKYLLRGDVYVHADISGSGSVFIKNRLGAPDSPIPPATLAQAGTLAVCSSTVWDSKGSMSAWWVNAEQVSKTSPAGDFMPVGSFNVKGQKNFLPPAPLIIGIGLLWKISDDSKANHMKHRNPQDIAAAQALASTSAASEPQPPVELESESESDVDGEDNDQQERSNPLQAASSGQDEADKAQDDVPSDKVAKYQISRAKSETKDPQENEERLSSEENENEENGEATTPVSKEKGKGKAIDGDDVSTVSGSQQNKAPMKRGQKAKLKKIAKKYKDQDEEDRAAAEELLGSATSKQKREEEAKAKAQKEAEQEAARARRRAQHERVQQETAKHEAERKKRMEEGGADEEDDPREMELLQTALESLVGTPLAGDEILEAVPVCAPLTALTRAKYKIKMQPGNTKKGRAVKDVLERWKLDSGRKGAVDDKAQDSERMWPREVELIKALRPEEVINIVPVGKVSVMASGAAGGKGKGGGGGGGKGKSGSGGGKGGGKGGKGGQKK